MLKTLVGPDYSSQIAALQSAVAQKADTAAVSSALSVKADSSSVPAPATNAPPGVSSTSETGSMQQRFAREDHTHRSSVQAVRLPVAGASGQFTWTFPTPYAVGSVPVCTATVETAAGVNQPYIVNMLGAPTNTQVTFVVFRAQTQTLAGTLLGLVINLFGFAPQGVVVNVIARLPSAAP